jgi:predicted component of type VI protein secretion system
MEKLNDVIKNTVHTGNITLEKAKIDRLAQGVGNLPKLTELSNSLESLRTEVTKSATLEVVQKQVVVMAKLLSDVNTTSNKMDHKIDDFDFKKG